MGSLWSRLRQFVMGASSDASPRRRHRKLANGRRGRAFGLSCVERLESREMLTVTYHGGALLAHVEAQPVFMGSDWSGASLTSQAGSLNQFGLTALQFPKRSCRFLS